MVQARPRYPNTNRIGNHQACSESGSSPNRKKKANGARRSRRGTLTMASVAPSTDQRVMSPLSSFSAPAPGAAESRNVSPPPNPEAAMEEALAARMLDPSRPRCHFGRGSGSSDRVRKNLVAARDIGGVKRESDAQLHTTRGPRFARLCWSLWAIRVAYWAQSGPLILFCQF